ncbi:MAG: phosphatase PAP2 family protein [Saprospiraceae bacterium]|nr:phosphatase PAP2 family protein [Saprospiraceae bacterium]
MMESLLHLDHQLFIAIHLGWACDLLDVVAPLLRNKLFWIPLYVFILSYIWYNQRAYLIGFILSIALLITVTDTISSRVIKPSVGRLRPCNTPEIKEEVRPLVTCGSGFSFTSSHATNHFALAIFMMGTFSHRRQKLKWLWLVWAVAISLSQVYVGVHFPLDILCGGLLGASIGWLTVRGYRYFTLHVRQLPL